MDASAYLADILARYASIEQHYGDTQMDDWPQLRDCIVDVYAAVLKYTFAVKIALQSGVCSTRILYMIDMVIILT